MERATGQAPRFFCICYNNIFYYVGVGLSANKKCYNMKQTIHKFLLLAVMAIVGIANAEAYTCCIDGIYYNVDKTKKTAGVTYASSSYSGYGDYDSVVIPESIIYEGVKYPVTRIASWAFKSSSSLTSVTIPGTVTSIGKGAFYACGNLKSIAIPDGVKSIEDSTFYDCKSLKSITIPNSVTSIGSYPFWGCNSLDPITIPETVTSFGDYALGNGKGIYEGDFRITPVAISNVKKIGEGAFCRCDGLKSITFSDSVTEIPDYTFYGCI